MKSDPTRCNDVHICEGERHVCSREPHTSGAHEDDSHSWTFRDKRRVRHLDDAGMIAAIRDDDDPAGQVSALRSMVHALIIAIARLHLSGTSERGVERAFDNLLETAASAVEILEKVDA